MNIYDVKLYVIEGSKNSERIDDHWVACSEEEALGKAVMEYKSKHRSGNFRIKDFKIDIVLKKQEKEEEMSKKVEIDVKDAKVLLEVCYPSAGDVCHRLAYTIEEADKEEVSKEFKELSAEQVQKICCDEIEEIRKKAFKMSPEGVKFVTDGRIDQLESKIEHRITHIEAALAAVCRGNDNEMKLIINCIDRNLKIIERLNDLEDLHRELRRAFTTQAELTQKILDIK